MRVPRPLTRVLVTVLFALIALVAWLAAQARDGDDVVEDTAVEPTAEAAPTAVPTAAPTATPEPVAFEVTPVDLASVGAAWSETVPGVLTFRGNPTRTFGGTGPVPEAPVVRWAYPSDAMCEPSAPEGIDEPRCGTGWPGQPTIAAIGGTLSVVFGGFDGQVHAVDAATGLDVLTPFAANGPITGSVTVDPDGFPLLYVGSDDGSFRVLSTTNGEIAELWSFDALSVSPTGRSDDWDSAAVLLGDLLVIGGENGQLHVFSLRRATGDADTVSVDPQLVFNTPAWDDEILAQLEAGDDNLGIEAGIAVSGTTVWSSSSAGAVQGWDLGPLTAGDEPVRVFSTWTGDDADATVVVDESGDLFVGQLYDRLTPRALELGHVIRLDPTRPDDPVVWSAQLGTDRFAGVRATPALHEDLLVTATNDGRLVGLDRATGELRWSKQLTGPTWGSPVIVDGVLIQGDCGGFMYAYDLADTVTDPPLVWSIELGGCLQSTPIVWDGAIYVGSDDGRVFALADN